jgi:TBC1 domain family protein 5
LNFPDDIDLKNLIEKAKLLQSFALERNLPTSLTGKSPLTPPNYWEETWKTLQMSVDKRSGGPIARMKGRGLLRRSNTESNVSRTKDAKSENSILTSTSQSIVDVPHNADIVPDNLVNSLSPMPIEHQKDRVNQGTEIIRSTSNSLCEVGAIDGSSSAGMKNREAREYIARSRKISFRRRTDHGHDTRHTEEPCVSHDVKVVNEPDPLSVQNCKIDEPGQTNGKIDEVSITNQTSESVDYQPTPERSLSFDAGPSLNVVDKELIGTLRSFGDSMVENIQVTMLD